MRTFKVKPSRKDLLVRDPETRQPLKAAGEVKPRNTYWLRRIKDKSVVEVKAKQQKQETEE
ncbi:DUF2635 domain-containing protein [Vibrio coralliilyticus]|uniref:DUF2635 domain-containing protein n=1 Tax=Vibrio coralliilyticus TaxID=190893 RepID=UPI00148B4A61|nr:DUF2635 domain-containing protein [Vibrio coralliilyticus]NOI29554.1 DUF2635 domain-containing protein [Vibrio coralliilyticus]NOI48787.1 DUF2635 domain-containing protein [Vibrio coralliilyticus]WFB49914.1 DUF2635 domain-containing protein [Vibrio coralliilyticus]